MDKTRDEGHGTTARFSDVELMRLREEFHQLKAEHERRWQDLAVLVEKNIRTTELLTASIQAVVENTEGIVRLYANVVGTVRVGAGLQRFLIWLVALGGAGAAIAAAIMYIVTKFAPPGP